MCAAFVSILSVRLKGIGSFDVRHIGKVKQRRQNQDNDCYTHIRDIKLAMCDFDSTFGIKISASDNWPQNPTDSIERLGKVNACRTLLLRAKQGRVRICHSLKHRQAHRNHTDAQQKSPKLRDMRCRDEPKSAK